MKKNWLRQIFLVAAMSIYQGTAISAEALCNPCDEVTCTPVPTFDFGGHLQAGIYGNSHGYHAGNTGNGVGHSAKTARTDFHLDQLYLYGEKTLNTKHGLDFGGRVDFLYGVDAADAQSFGDNSFDAKWNNQSGYGAGFYQLYGTVGYKNLTVKAGKFITPIGWEGVSAADNFFYSHSYSYSMEPSNHTGISADYKIGDRLTLTAAWTTGNNNGFENRYNDHGVLGGVTFNLTDNITLYYFATGGVSKNGLYRGAWRFDEAGTVDHQDNFFQSFCVEWALTKRLNYVFQYDMANNTDVNDERVHTAMYSFNQSLVYTLNDKWSVGFRGEWVRDQAGYFDESTSEYLGLTLGLNFNPTESLSIRPEIRHDSVTSGDSLPWGINRGDQTSGGVCAVYLF
jgi:hypothetical protein